MIKIKCATIRIIKTGEVFHGTISHSRIVLENEELHKLDEDEDYEFGFTTCQGEFVNRYKALRIARKANQTTYDGYELYSYMLKLEGLKCQ